MKRLMIIAAFLMPALLILSIATFRARHEEDSPEAHDRYAKTYLAEWNAKTYVPIATGGPFESELKQLNIQSNCPISEDKINELKTSLYNFFLAYSQGSYEAWLKFRRPAGVPCTWIPEKTNELALYFTRGPKSFRSHDHYIYWEAKYNSPTNKFKAPDSLEEKFKVFLTDLSGGNFYKDYWKAVCFDNARVGIDQSRQLPDPLQNYHFFPFEKYRGYSVEATFPNLGYSPVHTRRMFDFNNSPERVLSRDGRLIYASAFFLVKCQLPEETTPMLVRFYWENQAKRWLPCELIQANIRYRHLNIPVF